MKHVQTFPGIPSLTKPLISKRRVVYFDVFQSTRGQYTSLWIHIPNVDLWFRPYQRGHPFKTIYPCNMEHVQTCPGTRSQTNLWYRIVDSYWTVFHSTHPFEYICQHGPVLLTITCSGIPAVQPNLRSPIVVLYTCTKLVFNHHDDDTDPYGYIGQKWTCFLPYQRGHFKLI